MPQMIVFTSDTLQERLPELFLVNDQRDAQIPFYVFIFLFITLYMFRAHRAHHQERQIVSIQPLVTVTLKIGE
jgi:hypothetical protein